MDKFLKKDHLKEELKKIIDKGQSKEEISCREIAKIVGKLVSSVRALGNEVKILLRKTQFALDEAVLSHGWDSSLSLTEESLQDLAEIVQNLDQLNGHPIITSKTGITLNSLSVLDVNSPLLSEITPISHFQTFGGVVVSDASDKLSFSYSVTSGELVFQELFSEEECLKSSGFRELITIQKTIIRNLNYFTIQNDNLPRMYYWLTDSQNVFYWFR